MTARVGATAGRNPIDNGPCTTSVTDSHRIATIGAAKRNLTNHSGFFRMMQSLGFSQQGNHLGRCARELTSILQVWALL